MARWLRRLYSLLAADDPFTAALGAVVLLYYVLTPGIFEGKASGDSLFGFMYLPGLFFHGSLDLRYTLPDRVPYLGTEPTGRVANLCPIGPAFVWAPTYLLGLLLQKLRLVSTPAGQRFGHSQIDFWFAGLGALLFGQLGIAAMFRMVQRWLGTAAARLGTAAAVLATPLCFYLVTQPLYQHACAFTCVVLSIDRWDRLRGPESQDRPWQWGWLGALGGLAMTMRLQEGIVLLLPALTLLARLGLAARRGDGQALLAAIGRGLLVLALAALAFLPQLLAWIYFYGHARPPQPPGHMRWLEPAIVETLFSMRAGLFPWVPLLYLALPGLLLRPLRQLRLSLPLGLLFLAGFWVNASAWDFHGSWAFGPRRFTDATPIFAAGLGSAFVWLGRRGAARVLVVVAVAALIAYNGLLMELVRTRRVKSSAGGAFAAAEWVRWAQGPSWLGRALTAVGYPFAQPASWIYSQVYRIPPAASEGILGNYLMERDWRIRSFIIGSSAVPLSSPSPYLFVSKNPPPGTQVLHLILPLYTREPLRLRLHVKQPQPAGGPALQLSWNGVSLRFAEPARGPVLTAEVPAANVHSRGRFNEVTLSAPQGLALDRLELISYKPWWQTGE